MKFVNKLIILFFFATAILEKHIDVTARKRSLLHVRIKETCILGGGGGGLLQKFYDGGVRAEP